VVLCIHCKLVYGMHDFILISRAECLERRSTMAQKYNGRLYFLLSASITFTEY
jgi:hypothetical protein